MGNNFFLIRFDFCQFISKVVRRAFGPLDDESLRSIKETN